MIQLIRPLAIFETVRFSSKVCAFSLSTLHDYGGVLFLYVFLIFRLLQIFGGAIFFKI
jgi:hypothetical protein